MAVEDVARAMSAETWYTAEGAREAGLCDEVVETEERVAARIEPAIAARFLNVPESVYTSGRRPETDVAVPPAVGDSQGENAPEVVKPGKSHAGGNMIGTESEGKAIVLGNRVYRRKEN